jgi:transcriptional regulator
MATAKPDLLQGTLDLLILKTLLLEPNHGWGISQRIQQLSQDVLAVNQGSLYPALARLEEQGLIAAEWGVSANGRRAKFYALTPLGRRMLRAEETRWQRFVETMSRVLAATPKGVAPKGAAPSTG